MSSVLLRLREWPGYDSAVDSAVDEVCQDPAVMTGSFALSLCNALIRGCKYGDVILAFTVMAVISTSVGHSFMLAPYNKHVMEDLGISRTSLSSIWAITLVLSAGWLNVVGRIVDRYGARPAILYGGLAVMISLIGFSRAHSLCAITVSYTMIRLSSVETVDFACRHCMNQWFVDSRGFAAGILNSVSSIGFILPAVETMLICNVGWRVTAATFGTVTGVTLMLSSVFLLSRPEDYGLVPDMNSWSPPVSFAVKATEDEHQEDHFTLAEAVRTPVFWTLIICWMFSTLPWAGFNFWLVSILEETHHNQHESVYVYLMLSIFSAVGAAVSGVIIDKIPHHSRMLSVGLVNGAMLLTVLVGAALDFLPGPLGPLMLGSCLGLGDGTGNVVSTVMVPNLFGRRHLGAIQGVFMASASISSGVAPMIMALAMDGGVDFRTVCCVLACCQVFAIASICVVPHPVRINVEAGASRLLHTAS